MLVPKLLAICSMVFFMLVPATAVGLAQEHHAASCSGQEARQANSQGSSVDLSGGVGGSRLGFEAVYGAATGEEYFIEYDIEGCGDVFVSYFEDDVVIDISLFAPREGEGFDSAVPDDADWSIQEAKNIISWFLPSDSVEVGTLLDDEGLIMVEGYSPTLEAEVPTAAYDYVDNTPTYGGFSYAFHLTSAGEVSWITIQLGIEDEF